MGSCLTKPESNSKGSIVVPYSTPQSAMGSCLTKPESNSRGSIVVPYSTPQSAMGSCLTKPESNSRGSIVVPYSTPQAKRARLLLYGTVLCPFTSRIRIALEFKSIPVQVLWLSADDEKGRSKQLLAYMLPADGKLPILQHEDHTISGSSDDILEYIEATFPKPSLLGNAHSKDVKVWVGFIRDTFSPLIIKALYNGDLLTHQDTTKQLNAAFSKLDAAIAKHSSKGPYFYGDQFSLVDVYLIPFLLLERPLTYYQGIDINPAHSHLRSYSTRMTSFASYAPIRMDLDLLQTSVSKALAQCAPPPLVSMTLLQHQSMLRHFEKLVLTVDELIVAAKQPSRIVDPVKGSLAMQIKKLLASYAHLLEFMLEHAQMEERVIFPALERADRGLTKSANQSHARDLPVMNGIKEDFKAVVALEPGSPGIREALQSVATRLRSLQAHTVEHFQEEETELLPLLNAAGVGSKQQAALVGKCVNIMESLHAQMFPFLLSGLHSHQIHQYLNLLQKFLEEGKTVLLTRMMTSLKHSDDEYTCVWTEVKERLPVLASLAT